MNRIIQSIRSRPARFFLVLFLLLILPALILYPMAESGSQVGMGFALALIVLANIMVLFA